MRRRRLQQSNTRVRLVVGIVLASLLPTALLATVSINHQRGVAIDSAFEQLEGIAAAQVSHLESIAVADLELTELLANNSQLRAEVRGHNSARGVDLGRLGAILRSATRSSTRLVNICVHAADGTLLASLDPDAGQRYEAANVDLAAQTYRGRVIPGREGRATALTTAPIVYEGERIGSVAIEVETIEVQSLATEFSGLNETGETSIAQPTPTGAQFIAPLRFQEGAVLNIVVPQSLESSPISLAVAGVEQRVGDSVDYRDEPVLAVTRMVEATGWGLVVKMDRSEALIGVDEFRQTVMATLAFAFLLILLISLTVSRVIWRPVREVTAAAVAVAGGDRRRRARVERRDELGDLASAVNTMTDELVEAAAADASRRQELEDVNTRLMASEQQLGHQAVHDVLTGLANRSQLRNKIQQALTDASPDDTVAVLFIDLDSFKLVNDSRGHAAGDELLLAVAQRLTNTARSSEVVARFGGDEFVVLCPDTTAAEAHAHAERIHREMLRPFVIGGKPEHIGASIGIALSTGQSTPDALVSDADLAMYRAKAAGRSRTVVFDGEMRSWVEDRHELETALRRSIDRDELEVHYQPIVDLESGEIAGLEALSRWSRPAHGPVSPAEFIAVAEESGLIVQLGRSVFRSVCEQQVAWKKLHADLDLRVTVNLSVRELSQVDCFDAIAGIVHATGASPSLITLELTETALSSDLEAAVANLEALHQLGFSIAVDDFGTGYSSLTYLRQFPLDVVKIDRSFMTELEHESVESTIVSLVIGLGQNLGIDVVAEGVETEVQLAALRKLRCQYAQGYLFAKPQSASDIEQLLWPEFDADRLARFNMVDRG